MRTKSLTRLTVLLSTFACSVASSQDSGEPTAPSPTCIYSGHLVVMVSDSRDVIAAYSEPTAKIVRVELETPLPADENPVACGGVAMVRNEEVSSRTIAQATTAILRASAIPAFFRRVLAPPWLRANVNLLHSLCRVLAQAHSSSIVRSCRGPRLLIRPLRSVSPDWYCFGVRPRYEDR